MINRDHRNPISVINTPLLKALEEKKKCPHENTVETDEYDGYFCKDCRNYLEEGEASQ